MRPKVARMVSQYQNLRISRLARTIARELYFCSVISVSLPLPTKMSFIIYKKMAHRGGTRIIRMLDHTTCLDLALEAPHRCRPCIEKAASVLSARRNKCVECCCQQPWHEDNGKCRFHVKSHGYKKAWLFLEQKGHARRLHQLGDKEQKKSCSDKEQKKSGSDDNKSTIMNNVTAQDVGESPASVSTVTADSLSTAAEESDDNQSLHQTHSKSFVSELQSQAEKQGTVC